MGKEVSNMTALDVQRALRKVANPTKAKIHAGFFKTYKGGYGEGDQFLGITVPVQRNVAYQFADLPLTEIAKLLKSPVHEDRFTALEILVIQSEKSKNKKPFSDFYLKNTRGINNWDLVDTSAPYILGPVVNPETLYKLARSKNIWERRIAIVATQYFIQSGNFLHTLKIATLLLHDIHDLIHKATGWMLREVGKKDTATLERFLAKHARTMPRTMLRYAVEKFPEAKRKMYLIK